MAAGVLYPAFGILLSPVLAAVFTLGVFVAGHLSQSIRDFGNLQHRCDQFLFTTENFGLLDGHLLLLADLLDAHFLGNNFLSFHVGLNFVREIGLRLAIGALEREVLLQFLIEAVVLAALGGLVGIVLAALASVVLSGVMGIPFLFNPAVNVASFVFSAAIGVLFGYFPARRAARMDPIDALRHE